MRLVILLLATLFRSAVQIGQFKSERIGCLNNYNGTTKNIQEIVIGRCHEFVNSKHKDDCDITNKTFNCQEIWQQFAKTVIGKEPCSIQISDFDDYLDKTDHFIPQDSSLFWSGTYTPAHESKNKLKIKKFSSLLSHQNLKVTRNYKYFSLEDSLSGFLLDKISFCSESGSAKFNDASCPIMCNMIDNRYWNAASKRFASKAQGQIKVVLNGTRTSGAVNIKSTFLAHEVPEFVFPNVLSIKVLLLHELGKPKYETCNSPKTLQILWDILKSKNIPYECEDNPNNIIALFCFQDPFSKECQAIKFQTNGALGKNFNDLSKMLLLFSILYLILNN